MRLRDQAALTKSGIHRIIQSVVCLDMQNNAIRHVHTYALVNA
jgi:hypothetical protein